MLPQAAVTEERPTLSAAMAAEAEVRGRGLVLRQRDHHSNARPERRARTRHGRAKRLARAELSGGGALRSRPFQRHAAPIFFDLPTFVFDYCQLVLSVPYRLPVLIA